MEYKYKAVGFDLDGTLVDSLLDLAQSCNLALASLGHPQHTVAQIRNFVGNGVRMLISRALPQGHTEADTDLCLQRFREFYEQHKLDNTRPYDGIFSLVKALHNQGVATFILSNKYDEAVKQIAGHCFPGLIDLPMGECERVPRKPSPQGLRIAADTFGIKPSEMAFVGDGDTDMATAKAFGCHSVGVLWGYRTEQCLLSAGAGSVAADVSTLRRLLTA